MRSEKKRRGKTGKPDLTARLYEFLDVPAESMASDSLIEVIGTKEAVVSGCAGVLEYGTESVLVRVREGCIRITGECLTMQSLMNDRITVRGRIRAVYTEAGSEGEKR